MSTSVSRQALGVKAPCCIGEVASVASQPWKTSLFFVSVSPLVMGSEEVMMGVYFPFLLCFFLSFFIFVFLLLVGRGTLYL